MGCQTLCQQGILQQKLANSHRKSTMNSKPSQPEPSISNQLFVVVSGAGLPEVDGLFVPSTAPASASESGTMSSPGYWNGKPAWDRADGKSERSPSLSYSNSYRSWRISRLDGHLAYHITCDDELPPTDRPWEVYKMGVEPAPKVEVHYFDPRKPCPQPNVVFVLGGPGAGKGTMCELADLQLGWVHLSMGSLLRNKLDQGDPQASEIERFMAEGKLVPDEITVRLLKETMEKITRTTGKQNFLLDGFPRSFGNLAAWLGSDNVSGDPELELRKSISTESVIELPKMLFFECPLAELERRVMGRSAHTGRSDDNLESLRQRFATFKAETLPMVEYFKKLEKYIEIDTSQDRQLVYRTVCEQLAPHTDADHVSHSLCERAEILLGMRPYPVN